MAQVDPFVIPLPRKLAQDPEIAPYFTYLQKFLHDLWQRTGAGTDLVGDAVTDAELTSALAAHTASNDNTTQTELDAAFTAHTAASNPHPVYTTDAEVASAIAVHAGQADPHPTYTTAAELAAGISAHEGAANPHPTYLTQAEGDAAYQPLAAVLSMVHTGTGSPETVLTATVGHLFLRSDGGANTTLYVKESGSGNTGWIAK